MPEVIIRFYYNQQTLIVYKKENNIFFGKLKNGQINNDLTEEEQNIIKEVYNSLTIDPNSSIDCGTFKIKGKQIRILYCQKTNLYYFYEIINNKLTTLGDKTLKELNLYYNNQTEYISNKQIIKLEDNPEKYKGEAEEKQTFRRVIKINTTVVAVIIALNLALQELPVLDYSSYYLFNKPPKQEQVEEYSLQKLINSIKQNTNLTKEEQNFIIISLKDELEENKDYINPEMIYKRFKDIKIENKPETIKEGDKILVGNYSYTQNKINMYIKDDNKTEYNTVLFHELNHALTNFNPQSEKIASYEKNYFTEIINELYTREYKEEEPKSYEEQMVIMYPLCEILSEECIRKFKYNDKISYIIEDLLKIDSNIETAGQLITAINSLDLYYKNYHEQGTQESHQELEENKKTIYKLIKHYYEKKYNKDMTEDQLMMAYFCEPRTYMKEANIALNKIYNQDDEMSLIDINILDRKGYISKKYKQNHQSMTISYYKGHSMYVINISDENRYNKEAISPSEIYQAEETFTLKDYQSKTR